MTRDISRALCIPGWMSPGELQWLAEQASACRTIIEVGCYQGRTTRVLGDHVHEHGCVYSVDPWGGYTNDDSTQASWILTPHVPTWEDVFLAWCSNVRDLLNVGRVQCVRATSLGALPTLPSIADFVFLDGDHREATVAEEIRRYLPRVKKGGILAGHDYTHRDWPGVKLAVDQAFPHGVGQVESIWWVRA